MPLYEVPSDITSRCTIDARSNVMPGHPRICTSVQLVYREKKVSRRISHLYDEGIHHQPTCEWVSQLNKVLDERIIIVFPRQLPASNILCISSRRRATLPWGLAQTQKREYQLETHEELEPKCN